MRKIIKNYQKYIETGFTLVELMIVVAIIAIISALTLFNNAKLDSAVLLSNTAYEIGLIIRDAQISGLGAKVSGTQSSATTTNQGIYIDVSQPTQATQIISFSDKSNDGLYSDTSEINQIYSIENKRAGKILSACYIDNNLNTRCDSSNLERLHILFKRPNPEAYFKYGIGIETTEFMSGSVVINIGFEAGECRSIIVYKTGAIQVDKSYCPQN